MTRGVKNNNPGNIKISTNPWKGKVVANTDGTFEQFISSAYGLRALFLLLLNYYSSGLNTVSKIISKYAPNNENNTQDYIKKVSKDMGIQPDEIFPITDKNLILLADAICRMESDAVYMVDVFRNAIDLLPDSKKKLFSIPALVSVS